MPLDKIFTLSAIQINGSTPLLIDQVDSDDYSNNIEEMLLTAAGSPNPSFMANMTIAPTINFSSTMIKSLLDMITLDSGRCIPNSTIQTNVVFFFARINKCADRAGAGSHISLTCTSGLFVINQIRAAQGQPATADVTFHALFDGTNAPVVASKTATLPSNIRADEAYTLGPVRVNSTSMDDVQSVTIAVNPTIEKIGGAGDIYPTFAGFLSKAIRFEIEALDLSYLSDLGPFSSSVGSSGAIVYLRKVLQQGTRVADATAQHISFALQSNAQAGMLRIDSMNAQNAQRAGLRMSVTPLDNSAGYVTVNTATAIS